MSSATKSLNLGLNFDDDIEDYIDELKSMVISSRKTFFLPFSKELGGLLKQEEYNDYAENVEKITEFLELISVILDSSDNRTSAGGWALEISQDKSSSPQGKYIEEPIENTQNLLKEIAEARDAFDDMINNIVKYYIKPLSTQYKPFESEVDILNVEVIEKLVRAKKGEEPYFHLLSLRMKGLKEIFTTNNFIVIEKITELINFTTKPSILDSAIKLEKLLMELSTELVTIYGGAFRNAIHAELGAYYYSVLLKTLKPAKAKELEIFGKNAENLFVQVVDQKSAYPLHALIVVLNQSSGKQGELTLVANQLGLSSKRSKERKKAGLISYTKSELRTIVKNFTESMESFSKTIIKSNVDIKILEAHDNIRKILNKPVYYKKGDISNFDHIYTTQKYFKI